MSLKTVLCFLFLFGFIKPAYAAWSFNIGYHNPPVTTVGANFLHLWSQWAFETGVGYVEQSRDYRDRSATRITGDLNFKYLVGGGSFRPYVQAGTGWFFTSTLNANILSVGESLYGGAGFFVIGSGVYTYASYNTGLGEAFFQGGLGFDF